MRKKILIGCVVILAVFTAIILVKSIGQINAAAQGLAASFVWQGKGSDIITARVTQNNYTGTRPARVTFGVYWCIKGGSAPCAPDFSGDQKSRETLIFQDLDLSVPTGSNTLNVVLPTVSALAGKSCGRFQVDLGFKNGGGIIGGQVFGIGSDCSDIIVTDGFCPYVSTQAQVQKDGNDPWNDSMTITLGQGVNFGGFHNGTGRFAGDSVNNYSPNSPNVDFVIVEPGGGSSQTLTPPYPIRFTPTKTGTYSFTGKTRKIVGDAGSGYFPESGCTDTGFITVTGQNVATPSPVPTSSVMPSATPLPTPTVTPGSQVSPTPSPTSSPGFTTNTMPECVSLSATPAFGGAQLKTTLIGKGRDPDGIIRRVEFNFGDSSSSQTIEITNGETNKDTLASVTHTYTQAGDYTVSIRVRDNSGQNNDWSTTPESCRVKISVQGVVLGTTTQVKGLPKSGISEWLTAGYVISFTGGIGFKVWAKYLKSIS